MDELLNQSYPFEVVDGNPFNYKYDFVSIGEKEVPKRVSVIQYPSLEGYYNLGFGNITISDDGIEAVSDMSRDNNKSDADKVLTTVFGCALDFLSNNTESKLTFYGNTALKHRLYKMKICDKIDLLSTYFTVKGGIIQNLNVVETPIGKDVTDAINVDNIDYEPFNIQNSQHYHFIVFELKEEYKGE
jgi:hypothetical protein